MPPVGHKRVWPPLSVVVGVLSLVAAFAWLEALEPAVKPHITVEFQSLEGLIFGVALMVGNWLGVRILWCITLIYAVVVGVVVLYQSIQEPLAQTIGGSVFLVVGITCLLWPSAIRFEQRRIRLVLD